MSKTKIFIPLVLSCFFAAAGCNDEDINNCEQSSTCQKECEILNKCDYIESVDQCIENRSDWRAKSFNDACVTDYNADQDCDVFITCVGEYI